jgi:hypothetical protein
LDIAEKIGNQHDTKIQLIGGLCDLNDIEMSKYPHLHVRIPSWGQLLDQKYAVGLYYPEPWDDIGQSIKKYYPHHLGDWYAIADMIIKKNQSWKKIFHTDGCHPDRIGHQILHNHLYPEWAWKIQ